jgi:hypothetical protein
MIRSSRRSKTQEEAAMKIRMESEERVALIPENDHERDALDGLWKLVIRCDENSKVLCPIGQYTPEEGEHAEFVVQDQFPGKGK